jgi:ABC-type transport system involved in cytochrome c biogenesis permease subunit
VPVLNSYWLNIHVTIITSSYAFLGLSALVAMTLLVLHLFKGPQRQTIRQAVGELHFVHWWLLVSGLALLSVGTLLGGVWANESWGRYWGWDSKETWSLVTILVYAVITHFRFIPSLNRPWTMAAASFVGISAVIMTYFGVNYFLAGLHSYAAGDAAQVPGWIWIAVALMAALLAGSWWRDRSRSWPAGRSA